MKFVSDKGTFNISGSVVRSNLSTLRNGAPYYHAGVKFLKNFALELGSRQSILKQLDELRNPLRRSRGVCWMNCQIPQIPIVRKNQINPSSS